MTSDASTASVCKSIETWKPRTLKPALALCAAQPDLHREVTARYQELLTFVGGASLEALSTVATKLKARIREPWAPGPGTGEVLASIPIDALQLRDKKPTVLAPWVGYLQQLTDITITNCRLAACPDSLGSLANLVNLDLTSNDLAELPESLARLQRLETLVLQGNRLKSPPSWLGQLTALRVLDLAKNGLREFPRQVLELTRLEQLDLRDNEITAVPEDLARLGGLRRLDLRATHLAVIPAALARLTELRVLNLSSNPIAALPAEILALPHLAELDIAACAQLNLPACDGALPALVKLRASYMPLPEVPALVVHALNLEHLDLSSTSVRTLPPEILRLDKLAYLNVSSTPLAAKHGVSGEIVGHAEVQRFLQLVVEHARDAMEDAEIYACLESRDPERIARALGYLGRDDRARVAAEIRYLTFVRVRTGDPAAGLDRLAEAALTEAELAVLVDPRVLGDYAITFGLFAHRQCRLIVDVIGAIVRSPFHAEKFLQSAATATTEKSLLAFVVKEQTRVRRNLEFHARAYDQGWFGQVLRKLADLYVSKLTFDHALFDEANASPVLREFMFYAAMQSSPSGEDSPPLQIDIFQSTEPDLTELFWLMLRVPVTQWGDVTPCFPPSVLSFERKAKFKVGDEGKWQWHAARR
jgi:Leucine-rich repeat (LRR) protein